MANVKVRVASVDHTTIQSSAGNDLNYVVLKGYDETNKRGFKKQFFATKKDGSPTKNAETADRLQPNDWVEITTDDTKWENVQTLKTISAPSNTQAPDQDTYKKDHPSRPTGGGSPKKYRSVPQLNREVALRLAVEMVLGSVIKPSKLIETSIKLEDYLVHGVGKPTITTDQQPESQRSEPEKEPGDDSNTTGSYNPTDDIPF